MNKSKHSSSHAIYTPAMLTDAMAKTEQTIDRLQTDIAMLKLDISTKQTILEGQEDWLTGLRVEYDRLTKADQ